MAPNPEAASTSNEPQVRLGVCVLNWNAGEMLAKCVKQLLVAFPSRSLELVVVDNNSNDGSIEHLLSIVPGVRVLKNPRNLGYAKGNNTGAEYLCSKLCDYLLFVNPDVLLPGPSITALLSTLNGNEAAGAAGGLPQNELGVSRMAARTRPTPLEKLVLYGPLNRLPFLAKLGPRHFLDWNTLREDQPIYAVCGACLLFRSRSFQDVRGFDESTFLYEEELIMSERLRANGSFFVLSKGCTYFHLEAGSTRGMPYRRRLHFIESEQYLLKAYYRWGSGVRAAFRLCRYVEWAIYSATWKFRVKPPLDAGPSDPRVVDCYIRGAASEISPTEHH